MSRSPIKVALCLLVMCGSVRAELIVSDLGSGSGIGIAQFTPIYNFAPIPAINPNTAYTLGATNFAANVNGATTFGTSQVNASWPISRINDGSYAGTGGAGGGTWLGTGNSATEHVGVAFAAPQTINSIALSHAFDNGVPNGTYSFSYTMDAGANLLSTWTNIGQVAINAGERSRTVYSFNSISNVTGLRVTVNQATNLGGSNPGGDIWADVTELEAYNIAAPALLTSAPGPGGIGRSDGNSHLNFWLKADSLNLSNGATVATWNDSSGNGKNVTGSGSPQFISNEVNGRPVVRMDGSNGEHFGSVTLNASDFNNDDMTIIVALHADAKGAYHNVLDRQNTTPMLWARNTNQWELNTSAGAVGGALGDFDIVTAVMGGVSGGMNQRLYEDGTLVGSNVAGISIPSSATYTLFNRGGNATFDGDVAEMIVFSRRINDSERIIVENYLASKYGQSIANDKFSEGGGTGFDRDVFGVGRVNANDQVVDNDSAGLSIAVNPATLGDNEWIFAGHNVPLNSLTSDDLSSGERWDRPFAVEVSGTGLEAILTFDFASAGLGSEFDETDQFSLLYSATNAFDFVDLGLTPTIDPNSQQVSFALDSAALQTGFFTLGVAAVPEPTTMFGFVIAGIAAIGFSLGRRQPRVL